VLYQLHESPAATADTVIERFRGLPTGSPAGRDGRLLAEAHARLRGWVTRHSGIHAPHDPAVVPADVGNALRLRAARALENAIDDLAERHLRVAAHALPLYQSLRLHTTEEQARDTAIRRASVMYHSPSPGQGASAQGPRSARPPGPEPRSPGPPSGAALAGATARHAAAGLPGWPIPQSPLSQPGRADAAPVAGPHRPAPVPSHPARIHSARRQRR